MHRVTRRDFVLAGLALPALFATRSRAAGKADITVGITVDKGGVDFYAIKALLDDHSWKGWWTVELDRTGTTAKESCAIAKKYLEEVIKLKV